MKRRKNAPFRRPGPLRHARHPHGELCDRVWGISRSSLVSNRAHTPVRAARVRCSIPIMSTTAKRSARHRPPSSRTVATSSRHKGAGIPPARLTPGSGGLLFHRVRGRAGPGLTVSPQPLTVSASPASCTDFVSRIPAGPNAARSSTLTAWLPRICTALQHAMTYDNQQRLPAGPAPGFPASRSLGLRSEVRPAS